MNVHRSSVLIATAIAVASTCLLSMPAEAKQMITVRLEAAADTDAAGRARLRVRGESIASFDIQAHQLDPSAEFDVLIDTVKVGSLLTNEEGNGRARFRTEPRRRDQVLGFDPRGAMISIRNAAGEDVLIGTLPSVSGKPGRDNPGKGRPDGVACCLPHPHGERCQHRSEAECIEGGGEVSAAASCLPNPCDEAAVPGRKVVCCLPTEEGARCQRRPQPACLNNAGVIVEAESCEPNPCEPETP